MTAELPFNKVVRLFCFRQACITTFKGSNRDNSQSIFLNLAPELTTEKYFNRGKLNSSFPPLEDVDAAMVSSGPTADDVHIIMPNTKLGKMM